MNRYATTQFGTISTAVAVRLVVIAGVRVAVRVHGALAFLRLSLSRSAERLLGCWREVVKGHLRMPVADGLPATAWPMSGLALSWPVTWGRPAVLRVPVSSF